MSRPNVLNDIDGLKQYDNMNSDRLESFGILLSTASDQIAMLQDQLGAMYAPSSASGLLIGQEFFLKESGVFTPFIAVAKDYGATGNIICCRRDLLPDPMVFNVNSMLVYTGSEVDDFLRDVYEDTVEVLYAPASIVTAYSNGQSGTATLNVFAPSFREMTGDTYYIGNNQVSEGSRFSYFTSNSLRVAAYNGVARDYHTRSLQSADISFYITASGNASSGLISTSRYIRPFLSISANATIYQKLVPSTMNVLATAAISE